MIKNLQIPEKPGDQRIYENYFQYIWETLRCKDRLLMTGL